MVWLWFIWILGGVVLGWITSVARPQKNYPTKLDMIGGVVGALTSFLLLQLIDIDSQFSDLWYWYSTIVVFIGSGLVIWLGRILR